MTHHTTHTGDPDLRLGYAQPLPADGAVVGGADTSPGPYSADATPRHFQAECAPHTCGHLTITIEQPMTPQEIVRRLHLAASDQLEREIADTLRECDLSEEIERINASRAWVRQRNPWTGRWEDGR